MSRTAVFLIMLFLFSVPVSASEVNLDYYDEMLDAAGNTAENFLKEIGITSGNFEELLNIDFDNVLEQLLSLCRSELNRPLTAALTAFILLILLCIIRSVMAGMDKMPEFLSSVGVVMLSFSLLVPIAECIVDVISVCEATNDFMKVMIPIFAGIITASGNPSLALCFQSMCFSVAQTLSSFFVSWLSPLCALYSSLSVCGAISPIIKTNQIAQLLKKAYVTVLSFAASVFSALLSLKSVISVSADTVTVKGIKFIVGNSVPVVGSALSDALNSVISGISLMRSTFAVLAMILLVIINLPTLIEMLMWSIVLKCLSAVAGLLGQDTEGTLFAAIDGLYSLMAAVVIFQVFLYIISLSLIIIVIGMR